MKQAMWSFIHNCVAHPLLWWTGDHRLIVRLHDHSSRKAWPWHLIKPTPKKPMTDMMIDLETLATTPSACIVSIGAVLFDRHTPGRLGEEFYARVQIDASKGDVDADTVEWWMRHAAAWPSPEGAIPPDQALRQLSAFIGDHSHWLTTDGPMDPPKDGPVKEFIHVTAPKDWKPLTIWGHGADFDPPILHSAYHACGIPLPWGKGQVRDTRTLFDLTGYHYTTDGRETPGRHNALEDAKAQALAVQRAWAVLDEREAEVARLRAAIEAAPHDAEACSLPDYPHNCTCWKTGLLGGGK